ncbi:uncharacterized protein K460DRAFT_259755, partial [Cucurbitaria berberidis CBS 394.84]
PPSKSTSRLAPTCTINIFRVPSFQTNCTFWEKTRTSTSYTNCKGCEIRTKTMGLGLPCHLVTTVPGLATKTVTAC